MAQPAAGKACEKGVLRLPVQAGGAPESFFELITLRGGRCAFQNKAEGASRITINVYARTRRG